MLLCGVSHTMLQAPALGRHPLQHRYHQRMSVALQEVELTKVQDDPNVHFGDVSSSLGLTLLLPKAL